jgi:hypothetical protein
MESGLRETTLVALDVPVALAAVPVVLAAVPVVLAAVPVVLAAVPVVVGAVFSVSVAAVPVGLLVDTCCVDTADICRSKYPSQSSLSP